MTEHLVWRFAAASVIGSSHSAKGTSCEDYHAVRIFRDRNDEPTLTIVVSDGAGSAARSAFGSVLACQTMLEQLEIFFGEGCTVGDISEELGLEWLNAVREAIAFDAADEDSEVRDYACTLLLAIVGTSNAFYLQIGDGALVARASDGDWGWVFWPSRGEFANTTYFVTDELAAQNVAMQRGQAICEIAVFTDGIEPLVLHYATRSVFAPFFEKMFPAIRNSKAHGEDQALSGELARYLASASINSRTDDDKTLVLASSSAMAETAGDASLTS